jgi:hypothetical protein
MRAASVFSGQDIERLLKLHLQVAPQTSWGGQTPVAPPSEPVPEGMLQRRRAANPREQAGQSATGDLSFD